MGSHGSALGKSYGIVRKGRSKARLMTFGRLHRRASGPKYISREEGSQLLDRQARKYLGMSGSEFARRFQAGDLPQDNPNVTRVSLLLPMSCNSVGEE